MATRPVVLRLSAENADRVKAVLKDLGSEGQRGLKRIETAGKPASRSLQLVNAASIETTRSLDQLAGRAGPIAGLARAIGPIGLALGATAGAATVLAFQARKAAREVAEIGDAADRAGVAVDTFEQLRAALIQVGQPTASLESALSALNRRIGEARQGIGESAKVFQTLNIALEDADGPRSFEAVLADIADRFKDLDQSQRLALGQKLGEETFRSLVPVLEQGSEGLRRMADEAERAGLLFGGEVIRNAQELNKAFERQAQIVRVQLQGAFLEAGPAVLSATEAFASLIPVLADLVAWFGETSARALHFIGVLDELPTTLRLSDVRSELQQVRAEIDALGEAGGIMRGPQDTGSAIEKRLELGLKQAELLLQEADLAKQLEARAKLFGAGGGFTPPELDFGGGGGGGAGAAAQTGAFEQAMSQMAEQIAQQERLRREVGLTAGEVARLRAEEMLAAAAREEFGVVTNEVAVLIEVMANEIGKQTEATERATEAEKRWEEAAKKRAQAQEEAARQMTRAIEQAGDALADMVLNSENRLRRLAALLLQTFAGTGPFGGIVNQVLGVQGGGFIQAIVGGLLGGATASFPQTLAGAGQGLPNFSSAGSLSLAFGTDADGFRVPGVGGVDSQLMTMRLTPGERVRVESQPRRESLGPDRPVHIHQTWEINGSDPAMVEEVLMRHRETFARDAEMATMRTLTRLKQGARGTLGRLL